MVSFWVSAYFQVRTVSFREGIYLDPPRGVKLMVRSWLEGAGMNIFTYIYIVDVLWDQCRSIPSYIDGNSETDVSNFDVFLRFSCLPSQIWDERNTSDTTFC